MLVTKLEIKETLVWQILRTSSMWDSSFILMRPSPGANRWYVREHAATQRRGEYERGNTTVRATDSEDQREIRLGSPRRRNDEKTMRVETTRLFPLGLPSPLHNSPLSSMFSFALLVFPPSSSRAIRWIQFCGRLTHCRWKSAQNTSLDLSFDFGRRDGLRLIDR